MEDISGSGISIRVLASVTFPAGFEVTAFSDDTDPFDVPEVQIIDWGMGVNGDLVVWRTPQAIDVTIGVIPNTDEDRNLEIVYNANVVSKGKASVKDFITMVITYPDGTVKTLTQGAIVSAIPLNSVASAGRIKSKPYRFIFQTKVN